MNRGRGGYRGNYRGGRGGGRGGYQNNYDSGPPEIVKEIGYVMHPCEGELVAKSVIDDVPQFNAYIFLENKQCIGKVADVMGPMRDHYVVVKMAENMKAESVLQNTKLYLDPAKLLPVTRFLSKPPGSERGRGRGAPGRGGPRGRGGRGNSRGGRGRGGGNFRGGGGFQRGSFRGRGGARN